ncbi:hypothetical protein DPMN_028932 [Dreissena polymorpha]|uniref:Uncharacterized protein n=1 Tax=Dreissena polymorpha TaxID=45954 RepID=A0A9D4RFT0_DREPO|nr:hypothetical protein DPMN_028932 [Dreissena polymorpha]
MKLHRYIDHDSQMTPIDFEVTRIMKLHRYIDNDWQRTPIDFQVTTSKVKVTVKKKRGEDSGEGGVEGTGDGLGGVYCGMSGTGPEG